MILLHVLSVQGAVLSVAGIFWEAAGLVLLRGAGPRCSAVARQLQGRHVLEGAFFKLQPLLRESTGSESLSQEAGSAPPERGVARRCFGWRRSGWAGAQGGSWAALKFEIRRFLGASSGRRPSAPAQSSRRAGWRSQFNRRRQSSRRLDHRTRTHFF